MQIAALKHPLEGLSIRNRFSLAKTCNVMVKVDSMAVVVYFVDFKPFICAAFIDTVLMKTVFCYTVSSANKYCC